MAYQKSLQDFQPYSTEMKIRDRITGLEKLETPSNLRKARLNTDSNLLDISKRTLLDYLLKNSARGVLIDGKNQGRRYLVFSVNDCYIKVLVSEGRYSVMPPDRVDLERIFNRHAIEHAAVEHYFSDAVPDTLFFNSETQLNADNRFSQAMERNPFMVQEGIEKPKTILEASQCPIAETTQFPNSLRALLDSFNTMGKELGYVPDIPGFHQQNVLVDPEGKAWVVDTNTLVTPDHYHRFGFNFTEELGHLVQQLEKGHLPGNPQG